MRSQGRNTDFRTRKSIYDLKGLAKRLGPYRGTESQNFALKNIVSRENENDIRLMKSKSGQKHVFDVPGGSQHTSTGDPITAQQSAVNKVYPIDVTGRVYNIAGVTQQPGPNQTIPGLTYGASSNIPGLSNQFGEQALYQGSAIPGIYRETGTNRFLTTSELNPTEEALRNLGLSTLSPTAQTPREAAGLGVPDTVTGGVPGGQAPNAPQAGPVTPEQALQTPMNTQGIPNSIS